MTPRPARRKTTTLGRDLGFDWSWRSQPQQAGNLLPNQITAKVKVPAHIAARNVRVACARA